MNASPGGPPAWLGQLNAAPPAADLLAQLRACCAAPAWIDDITSGRPYADADALLRASDAAIARLDDGGLAQALAAHPRIGERAPAGAPAEVAEASKATEAAWSRQEQAGMGAADAALREQVVDANRRYEARFDRVYLICATGLSAQQMLDACLARLGHDDETEVGVVRTELAKIVRIRLGRLLHPGPDGATTPTDTAGAAS